jgi:6-phosphogluconolactonase
MNRPANDTAGAAENERIAGPRRLRLVRALRWVPTVAALGLSIALIGACGDSIYPRVSDSATATPTITTSPTTGNFLYSSNFGDGKVARFTRNISSGTLTFNGLTAAGAVKGPTGIANGLNAQFLYVTNPANNNVRQFKITSSSGALTPIGTGAIATGKAPQWIAVTPNAQFAYVTNFGAGTISEYTVNASSGALTANGTFTSNKLKAPVAAVASTSWLYVTDSTNGTIVSFPINPDGTLAAGTATSLGSGTTPGPVIMDPTGKYVYVTDESVGAVYFLTVGTGVLTFAAGPYQSSSAGEGGLALATNTTSGTLFPSFLYVANQMSSPPSISLFLVNTDGSLSTPPTVFPDTTLALLNLPTGLVVDPTNAYLYVANQGNGTVTQLSITTVTGALTSPVAVSTGSATSKPLFLAIGD